MFVLVMNSCFVQSDAPLEIYVKVAKELDSFMKQLFVFCPFQIHFRVFQIYVVSIAVYNIFQIVCIHLLF